MNLGSKKTILKACLILQMITFAIYILSFITIIPNLQYIYYIAEVYQFEIKINLFIVLPIHFIIYTLVYGFCFFYFPKKLYQNKENYYKNIIILKIISILFVIFDIIIAILLIICAFSKDDNKDEEPQYKRKNIKKKKIYFNSETQKQLKQLKSQKRKGIISQELYEKKYNEIVKNNKNI